MTTVFEVMALVIIVAAYALVYSLPALVTCFLFGWMISRLSRQRNAGFVGATAAVALLWTIAIGLSLVNFEMKALVMMAILATLWTTPVFLVTFALADRGRWRPSSGPRYHNGARA